MRDDDDAYLAVAVRGRDAWFARVKAASACVWPVLSSHASTGARGRGTAVRLPIGADGHVFVSRRAIAAAAAALADARAHGRRLVWLPVTLVGGSKHHCELHANAIWIDSMRREAWVFEPHGGDPSCAAHDAWARFYDADSYATALSQLLPGLRVRAPRDWMPPVWGQSLVGGRWCALWCAVFLAGASTHGPREWVAQWTRLLRDKTEATAALRSALHAPAQWMHVFFCICCVCRCLHECNAIVRGAKAVEHCKLRPNVAL